MKILNKIPKNSERGQAIIIIIFAFIGLVAMVGLVTDTGLVLIEYGKLKKAVDAASIAAAQEYRPDENGDLNVTAINAAAINFLQVNGVQDISEITIHTCEDTGSDRPALCNSDPIGNPEDNRKLVEITATTNAPLGFLRVVGLTDVTLTATSVGEAATIDLVLVMDTSASMAFETGTEDTSAGTHLRSDSDDDPSVCNLADNCQPMKAVKEIALDFVESLIFFGYDRVSIITMTSQNPGENRYPLELIPLSFTRNTVVNGINNLKVFEPRDCDGTGAEGVCLQYVNGSFTGAVCEIFELHFNEADQNPSSCPSSNVGGALRLAQQAFVGGEAGTTETRTQALWVVVALIGGPANATDTNTSYPNGYCPRNTWHNYAPYYEGPWCRDPRPSTRHAEDDVTNYTNPISGNTSEISIYDADDYARDMADSLAASKTNSGVTIYTIGLGAQIQNPAKDGQGNILTDEDPPGEALLQYVATEAGDGLMANGSVNHGQYFYAPTSTSLSAIFELIAQNIVTKISQ